MSRMLILSLLAVLTASSVGCRCRSWSLRDLCRSNDDVECMPCNECGMSGGDFYDGQIIEGGPVYQGGPIYQSPPSMVAPSTLPAPASFTTPINR